MSQIVLSVNVYDLGDHFQVYSEGPMAGSGSDGGSFKQGNIRKAEGPLVRKSARSRKMVPSELFEPEDNFGKKGPKLGSLDAAAIWLMMPFEQRHPDETKPVDKSTKTEEAVVEVSNET